MSSSGRERKVERKLTFPWNCREEAAQAAVALAVHFERVAMASRGITNTWWEVTAWNEDAEEVAS